MFDNEINDEQRAFMDQFLQQREALSWKQAVLENIVKVGLSPMDSLELRITCKEHTNIFQQAQKAADAFFSAFDLYPTSLAVHSTIARLFEASEHVVKAKHRGGENFVAIYGNDLVLSPLRIEIDDSLDTKTIAVRFAINADEYKDTVIDMLKRFLGM